MKQDSIIAELKDIDKMFTKQQQNIFIMISLIILLGSSFFLGTVYGKRGLQEDYYELLSEYQELRNSQGLIIDFNKSDTMRIIDEDIDLKEVIDDEKKG